MPFPRPAIHFAAVLLALASGSACALEPFSARYLAFNEGKQAGEATLQVVQEANDRWRINLNVRGNRGLAGLLRLNADQSTVFQLEDDRFRPLEQSTVKHALFTGRKVSGRYDWNAHLAHWEGDISKKRRDPVPLRDGDLSTLLMNLAVIRDAQPGATLDYRVVDNGRAREYRYAVAADTEIVQADDELSYDAMRVARSNGGNDDTIFWVASGVPTPVRILQREDGQDGLDLRLVDYQGVQ
ncbi:hypothetical protein CSC70_05825 [Pseudoxanthomonas kalamensis DSM 18571]|uniref:DUF3108 domain-containing protein n=1 Tax=Pseudoxanthomonas kalamensis TaxID=289483 RepID=UPI0013911EF0|nr:DUF3108 domain-containing protein [Pseudoxanthomonas kalamensis]KAF1711422.1 hypothetical protein CSC70_05825 [Pseudoxanthomonas kalamensis DSM 18571]